MKMKNVAKNFGLCMVGFISGIIATSVGVLYLVKKSRNIQNGISKEVEKWLRGLLFNEKVDLTVQDSSSSTGYHYPDIVLATKEEAKSILDRMKKKLDEYGVVTVSDFLDLTSCSSIHYENDHKYGWVNVDAHIVPVPKGWKIVFKHNPKEVL